MNQKLRTLQEVVREEDTEEEEVEPEEAELVSIARASMIVHITTSIMTTPTLTENCKRTRKMEESLLTTVIFLAESCIKTKLKNEKSKHR